MGLGDIDQDEDLDIVNANAASPNKVFLNRDNAKIWEEIMLNKKTYNTYDISTADLNGDGRIDIIESNSDDLNVYYLNHK